MKLSDFLKSIFRRFFVLLISSGLLFSLWTAGIHYSTWLKKPENFQIRKITVRGNDLFSEEELLRMGNVAGYKSIWDVNLSEVEKRIARNPFLEEVTVERFLPDIIRIRVKEKRPIALLNFKGTFFCLDREGLVMPSKPGKLYDLPILSGKFQGSVSEGSRVGGSKIYEGLYFVMIMLKERPELYTQISEIQVTHPEGLVLYTSRAGVPVIVGSGGWNRKLCYLQAILDKLVQEKELSKVSYIDLRFQDQIVVGTGA